MAEELCSPPLLVFTSRASCGTVFLIEHQPQEALLSDHYSSSLGDVLRARDTRAPHLVDTAVWADELTEALAKERATVERVKVLAESYLAAAQGAKTALARHTVEEIVGDFVKALKGEDL